MAVENDAVAALLSLLSKRDRGWCIAKLALYISKCLIRKSGATLDQSSITDHFSLPQSAGL